MTSPIARLRAAALACAAATSVTAAHAHISLEQGGTHLSRDGDANLKEGPCGLAGSTRGTHVYTYKPGETITVKLIETIPHPSYFRFAFDDDGDDAFVEPQSIQPIDPARPCPYNAADHCGAPDYYNNAAVLPNMDYLDPHMPGSFGTPYSWDVTLPNVTCNNCTLQVIQVMEDTIHGAYNPTPGDPNDTPYVADIYHQCIDLTLAGSTTGADGGGGGGAKSSDSGGCSVSGLPASRDFAGLWVLALGTALVARRRRAARTWRAAAPSVR